MTSVETYAVITPARNEARNLAALATSLAAQTRRPDLWLVVDDGSVDETREVAEELARRYPWVTVLPLLPKGGQARGGPVVRAFTAGVRALDRVPEVIVKIDADLTFDSDYCERLLREFENHPRLGIASGVCLEFDHGEWLPSYGTRSHVWGASRAYRRECLELALPLEEREGWDEIDALKVRLEGWETRVVPELFFKHHRKLGSRDGDRRVWLAQGEMAHYMGYRVSYLVARTVYRVWREPRAALMLVGYLEAVLAKRPRLSDARVRRYLRQQQRLRSLPLRARELRGQ